MKQSGPGDFFSGNFLNYKFNSLEGYSAIQNLFQISYAIFKFIFYIGWLWQFVFFEE